MYDVYRPEKVFTKRRIEQFVTRNESNYLVLYNEANEIKVQTSRVYQR